jgi:uncharacterized surface anchored protein
VKTDSVSDTPDIPATGERQEGMTFRMIVGLLLLTAAVRIYLFSQRQKKI